MPNATGLVRVRACPTKLPGNNLFPTDAGKNFGGIGREPTATSRIMSFVVGCPQSSCGWGRFFVTEEVDDEWMVPRFQ